MDEKRLMTPKRLLGMLLVTALLAPAAAFAGISYYTWQFNGTGSVSSGGITATPSARSFTDGTNNDQLANASLYFYSGNGLGIRNADCCTGDPGEDTSPEHTIDNNGRADLVLVSFSQAVNLQQVTIGWAAYDSDITVLAFKPNDATANTLPTINGLNHSQLLAAGFQLIANKNGPDKSSSGDGTDFSIATGSSASSYFWLIGAYDYRWTGSVASGLDKYDDYVKILSLYGSRSNGVPEPHALLLLGVAMMGLWVTRRPRNKAA